MQNSGYFYQSAAEYAVKRKELAQRALDVTGMGKVSRMHTLHEHCLRQFVSSKNEFTKYLQLQPTGEIPTPEYLGQILTEAEQVDIQHQEEG